MPQGLDQRQMLEPLKEPGNLVTSRWFVVIVSLHPYYYGVESLAFLPSRDVVKLDHISLHRWTVPRYFFSTIIGNVDTFLKRIIFGTVDTFLAILLDISVTFFEINFEQKNLKIFSNVTFNFQN